MYAASEKKRREDQIAQLNDEIQGLHNTIRNIKNSNDIALEDVTKRALHYKRERDDLGASLEAADRSAKYYRTLSEELKRDLNRERGMQGDKERALQRDLRDSSKDVSELKRQLDVQSRLLSQRTSELSQSRQQLRAMNLGKAAPKIRFPEKYKDAKSDSQQARNSSEPEEGQLNDRQPGPSSPPAQASSHHQTVLPMLEKAFIYLEELTNAALLEAHPVEQRDSDSPKNRKRQRLT
jgi:chromosome segregation ATPase